MRAGEAQPFFEALKTDLSQTDDPALRSWYETEMSLTSEHREASELHGLLQQLGSGISQLAERAQEEQTEELEAEQPVEVFSKVVDEVTDKDQWLTPEERKQKAVLSWLKDVTVEYDTRVRAARTETKKSKKEKQLLIAKNRFVRQLERFDEQDRHIVYDTEALKCVMEELSEKRPNLAAVVEESSVNYLHTNGVEFAEDHPAFAGLIRHSLGEGASTKFFDTLLTAVHDEKQFLDDPEAAVRLRIALAYTLFETADVTNVEYFRKIIDIAYLRNSIIREKRAYVSALEGFFTIGTAGYFRQMSVDAINAHLALYQARRAYVTQQKGFREQYARYRSTSLGAAAAANLGDKYGIDTSSLVLDADVNDLFKFPQHYDQVEVFPIEDEACAADPQDWGKTLPDGWESSYRSSDIYKKRIAQLAPKAIAHEYIAEFLKEPSGSENYHIVDMPLSPGVALSHIVVTDADNKTRLDEDWGRVTHEFYSRVLDKHLDKLKGVVYALDDEGIFRFGRFSELLEIDDYQVAVIALVRSTVTADLIASGQHSALITSLRHEVMDYQSAEEIRGQIDEKKERIRERHHNFLGRRPLRFSLPDSYRDHGLMSIEMRQHEDRSRVVVTAHHEEGDLEFLFNRDFDYVGLGLEAGETAISLGFEKLVVSLFGEWACRPVVETSEGTVSAEDTKSRVNLGFLRYLPEGSSFSDRQQLIFREEQRGNLAAESLRRKPLDPTGIGRNSTYVREKYDPNSPPLEVYYDPRNLAATTS